MSMSISSATSASPSASTTYAAKAPERVAFRQLTQALKSGDMAGAQKAYVSMVKNAPAGATWDPNSPFAQLGKAIQSGDVGAAQSAYAKMVESRLKPPVDQPVPTTPPISTPPTDASSGTLVNTTA